MCHISIANNPRIGKTPPSQSMITQLFPIHPINVMVGINNDATSAPNISMVRNLITNQVKEVSDSLPKNLGN